MPVSGVTTGTTITEAWGDSVAAAVTDLEAVMSTAGEKALLTQLLAAMDAASGKVRGIEFPAVQVPAADANTLDDYEEGTWTPALTFGGAAVGMTFHANNAGHYTKIGRLVAVSYRLALTNKGSSTGAAVLGGLPFTAVLQSGLATAYYTGMVGLTGFIVSLVSGSGGTYRQTTATTVTDLTNAHFSNTSDIIAGGVYMAA